MITTEQILAATGEELERLLGEVLQPCDCEKDPGPHSKHARGKYLCNTCNVWVDDWEYHTEAKPVYLTWPDAMKWRDWAVEEYGVFNYLYILKNSLPSSGRKGRTPQEFIMALAKPEQHLKAAAICMIGAE